MANLGPILFHITINDIHEIVYHLLFVDDLTLLSRGSTPTLEEEMAAHAGEFWSLVVGL